jgi:UDP-N-acetylmuramoylalanine--D-glutamate ligase
MLVPDIKQALATHLGLDPNASKVLVVGLGDTGFSVARFLNEQHIRFAVVDSRDRPPLLAKLADEIPDAPIFTGGFDEAAFKVASHLIISPGVSLKEYPIVKAIARGAKVFSDIDLLVSCISVPVVGITGSNGKSTVTTMVGAMAKEAGRQVAIGGNLGTPALDLLQADCDLYVLELSSFQLERTSLLNAAASTVLNVTADHMDRHDSMEDYAAEKQKIFNGDGVMVINLDDPWVKAMVKPERKIKTFSIHSQADYCLQSEGSIDYLVSENERLMALSELPLEGLHNASNALAALALGDAIGLDRQAMCNALRQFKGLDHRMQRVAKIRGITWVNDSKATNIGACLAALQGYKNKVILIAGGDAKGADMNELVPVLREKAKAVILMGKDGPVIEKAINGSVPVYSVKNIAEAVNVASGLADKGETVLLSPACASLDQFKSYKERGEKFATAVFGLQQ